MTTQEKIDVLSAFRDGKEIEFRAFHEKEWHPYSDPLWNFSRFEYRVKPEPRRVWVNEYPDGLSSDHYSEKQTADMAAAPSRIRAVEFVEVLK